jgi:uncharacterized protein YbaA (DUF1428 family)
MAYVDGFVLAVPKDKLDNYKAMAAQCAPIWKEFGATDYVECIGDDTPYGELTSFPRAVQAKDGEIVVFSWIVYDDIGKARRRQQKDHGRPAPEENDGKSAFRRQTHDLWRVSTVPGALSHPFVGLFQLGQFHMCAQLDLVQHIL